MAKPSRPSKDCQLVGDKAHARRVASLREDFNAAIEGRDIDRIATVLCEDALLVPGDEADLIQGRASQLEAWTSIFSQAPDAGYVRSPQRIEISDDGALAAESGRWRGGWSTGGFEIRYTGRYFAKWRFTGADWQIESETFVTLKRTGGPS